MAGDNLAGFIFAAFSIVDVVQIVFSKLQDSSDIVLADHFAT